MATTVGPARVKADNPADRISIAAIDWLPVSRFHVGTSPNRLTPDAGYTTATEPRVDLLTASLLFRGRSPYMGLARNAKIIERIVFKELWIRQVFGQQHAHRLLDLWAYYLESVISTCVN